MDDYKSFGMESGMKGKKFKFDMTSYKDPVTGVEIVRITDNKALYDRPYFTTPQFSADGKYTIFVSDFTHTSIVKNPDAPAIGKIGFGELFLLDIQNGEALQLTQGEAIKMGHGAHAMLSKDAKWAYFYSNEYLKSVNLETLETSELMWVPFTYNFHSLTMTDDGRFVGFSVVEEVTLMTSQFTDPLSGSAPGSRERFFKQPSSLVIRYDVEKKKGEVVTGGHDRITHTSFKPDDADYMVFCHDGPWELVQRLWTVRVSTDEVNPLVRQTKHLERVGHEFTTAKGRIGAQYSYRYRPDMKYFQNADILVDFDGKNEERFYYPYLRPEHINVNYNETIAVGDRAMLTSDMKDSNKYIALIEYDRNYHKAHTNLLCAHGTSGLKSAHSHPVFTPDGTHVVFSSDKDGCLNIYMAEADMRKTVRSL